MFFSRVWLPGQWLPLTGSVAPMRQPMETRVLASVPRQWHGARWAFFTLLGCSALVKGIGFGAVLIVLVATIVLVWQRDSELLHDFGFRQGGAGLACWPWLGQS